MRTGKLTLRIFSEVNIQKLHQLITSTYDNKYVVSVPKCLFYRHTDFRVSHTGDQQR